MAWDTIRVEMQNRVPAYKNLQGIPQYAVMTIVDDSSNTIYWDVTIEDSFFIRRERLSEFQIHLKSGTAQTVEEAKKLCESYVKSHIDGTMRIPEVEQRYANNFSDVVRWHFDEMGYTKYNVNAAVGKTRAKVTILEDDGRKVEKDVKIDFNKSELVIEDMQ